MQGSRSKKQQKTAWKCKKKTWKFSVFPKYSVFQGSPKQQVCPRFKRLNTVVHEVYRYFDKKWKKKEFDNFSKFCLFRSRFRTISYRKTVFISFLSILDNTYFPCWPFSTFQLAKSVKNLEKMHEIFENWKFLGFLSFSVSIWDIFNQNIAIMSSLKTTGSTNFFIVDPSKHSNPRSLWNFNKKCIKLYFESWKILCFLSISVSVWDIFI